MPSSKNDPWAWSDFGANDKQNIATSIARTRGKRGSGDAGNSDNALLIEEDETNSTTAWRQQATAANSAAREALRGTENPWEQEGVLNTAGQANRVWGGIAQGATKTLAAPGIALESLPEGAREFLHVGGASASQPGGDAALDAAASTQSKPITEAAAALNTGVQDWTDSWVAAPAPGSAEFVAKVADATGEAVPAAAAAVLTGGSSAILTGTALSYGVGGANAFSTEMIEGSGDPTRAVIAGVVEAGTEALGGAVSKYATKIIPGAAGQVISKLADSPVGEGTEEIVSGAAQSVLTGDDNYTPKQALEDFALGATVGAVLQGGASGINAVANEVNTARLSNAVNADIRNAANMDVGDIQELISHAGESTANAIVAQDSLAALQKRTANPVNALQITKNIPSAIAQQFGLVPAAEASGSRPVSVTTRSHESIVNPIVSELSAPDVSIEERATANPADASVVNPNTVYRYNDIRYYQPGEGPSSDVMETYRGQGNQFYRSSQEQGSIPASAPILSNEGSGVYSALDTSSADLYGPSGKLADNPYRNRGIDRTAIDVDYPVGTILQQRATLNETVSPLERRSRQAQIQDAQTGNVDVVPEGERRVRYDDSGRGLITEVVNNPADVRAVGLIFGRSGASESAPIQYSLDSSQSRAGIDAVGVTDTVSNTTARDYASVQRAEQLARNRSSSESTAESPSGEYVMPNAIEASEVASVSQVGGERTTAEATPPIEEVIPETEITESPRTEPPQLIDPPAESTPAPETETGPMPEPVPGAESPGAGSEAPETPGTTAPPVITDTPSSSQAQVPTATQEIANSSDMKRKRERAQAIWNPLMGRGATGEVYETEGYNQTFSGLSSY